MSARGLAVQAPRSVAHRCLAAASSRVCPKQRLLPPPPPPPPLRPSRRRSAVHVCAAQKQVFKSFDDMIQNSELPVLVDFYATWCGPCQMMSQILDQVAPELRGQVKFVKVDSEKFGKVAGRYNVGALPTLVLFKNGQPIDRVEGVLMPDQLKQRLRYALSKS